MALLGLVWERACSRKQSSRHMNFECETAFASKPAPTFLPCMTKRMFMTAAAFVQLQTLAETLLPHALEPSEDGAHDLSHLQRVWHNVRTLQAEEGGDLEVLLAAVLLHDCVAVEKNSPLRSQASRLAAKKAASVLLEMHWPEEKIIAVNHAIE